MLLIAGVLGSSLKRMIEQAEHLGLDALVEIHDEQDLYLALDAGAKIIGVNNRDLKTFDIDLKTSEVLRPKIPLHILAVSESGITSVKEAKRMKEAGYDAILVGEALVKSKDPTDMITKMRKCLHED